ncbi:DExH-box ATP-dependent RNA helicase DExH18, mitochondrial [Vitis vinifera]|uniref:DExH-box ATP-dependent RNA helicase DExH18, mitochondrial n=1 Tax=Vitis vinifera TaxID=29760 RepID=A0A438HE05_VITVI|nr:DExH-box ATP-dependent RNA helicase DExH18, mitochondrial [Vitis vinifera]
MARGPAALLSRIRSSKHDVSRFRVFPSKRCIHSFGEWRNPTASAFDLSKPAFFTSLMNLVHLQSASGSPNLRDFLNSIGARHFSSMREDGDGDENTVPGLTIEDGDDVSSISDSTMVENGDEGKSNCDSSMVESGNSSDDVGSGESVGYEHVAYRDPAELYRELCDSQTSAKPTKSDWEMVSEILHHFRKSGWAANQALAIYIGMSFFPTAASKFRSFMSKKCTADVAKYLASLGPGDAAVKFLFPIFVEFCLEEFPDEIKRFRSMIKSADLTKPHTWFPFARAMKRKIIYHCGPTNSGKTYNALQRYMEAKKGIYCSPLRLLAMEVFDKMMSDPCRGYAWTRALLGLKADEIHLCGDPSVLNVVRKICSETGDELFEQHYERFKPLVVEAKTLLGELQNVRSGDCVVAFSRREIFEVKLAIEKHTNHRCCVIYGALPPETRRQQASLFNDPDNEYDVLVASDAVGMGLNLNIRRVVFYSLSKYNGDKIVPVPATQVKQIAGRAGRRGSRYPDGLTTTLHLDDLDYLIECLKQPFDDIKKVKVQGLSLEDRFNFCFAPVNIRDPKAMYHLLRFASSYSQNLPVNIAMGMPKGSARNDSELLDLETKHQVLSMYLWLSHHFTEETFPYVKKAETMATGIADLLGQSLSKACWKPESRQAGKPKPQQKEDGQSSGLAGMPWWGLVKRWCWVLMDGAEVVVVVPNGCIHAAGSVRLVAVADPSDSDDNFCGLVAWGLGSSSYSVLSAIAVSQISFCFSFQIFPSEMSTKRRHEKSPEHEKFPQHEHSEKVAA